MAKGISVTKKENISEWYTEVIQKADIVDYSDVSGCIIFKPYCYEIWEILKEEVDKRFKKAGIKNCYFPLFIPEKHLVKEADHVEGFAPEVAWVTHAGNSEMAERLAVRPTSETIMYPAYAKWIRSWRDLPLRLNQWNNVVRWEFKHPVPLMRSREFLWNEGHTVFATKEEAEAEGKVILGIYEDVLRDFMAIYGVPGYKSDKEKFAGAEYTCSIESFLDSGKAIQGPDFHHDGQNFAKAFDITFLDKNEERQYVYQNTFAITTRMIGVMIMMHGDDKGLIIPPRIAPLQAVVIPIYKDENRETVLENARSVYESLDVRSEIDESDEYSPGWKFNQYEMKGVPVRIEIGPKDVEAGQVVVVRRDTGEKETVKQDELNQRLPVILDEIQKNLYEQSRKNFDESIVETGDFEELKKAVDEKKMVLAPFCNTPECEDVIKDEAPGVTTRNSPFDAVTDEVCVKCKKKAKRKFYFARAY
ncbi:MAG: proline--tRNA ligase [Candidatus Woesearchaeota archaeon]